MWTSGNLDSLSLLVTVPTTRAFVLVQARYAKRAKHVDVFDLKAGVWRELKRTACGHNAGTGGAGADAADQVSFQDILRGVRSGDGGQVSDLSVHLCVIVLLHLANEHSLVLQSPETDELLVSSEGQLSDAPAA